MRGAIFEKVGVNVSHVWGVLSEQARGQVAGAAQSVGRFVACGISLVAHMWNPYVPAVHMNLRYLRTSSAWFGGGSDLTPTFPFEEDTAEFHAALQAACDGIGRTPIASSRNGATGTFICRIVASRGALEVYSSTSRER